MAIVKFDGQQVQCKPVRQVNGSTDWIMSSLQHTARLTYGTYFRVTADEIVKIDEHEVGVPGSRMGMAELEAAMAAERETLPTPAQVIRDNPPIAHDAPNKVGT